MIEKDPTEKELPEKLYDPTHNPDGLLVMGVAENALMTPVFTEYTEKHSHLHPDHLRYRWTTRKGFAPTAEEALPNYINDTFHPIIPVTQENSVAGAGVGSLISQFCWHVCEDGDAFLITAPFYDGFRGDCAYPSGTGLVVVDIPPSIDPLTKESVKYLEAAIKEPKTGGPTIRGLILCNPHNPLGTIYPTESIVAYAQLAEKYDLHLLVDEIYGNQVYASSLVPHPPPFVSALSLDLLSLANCNPSRVHVVAGPSKDFGASGLCIGIFISQHNPELVKLMDSAAESNQISGSTNAIFAAALSDRQWRDWFLEENRRRTAEAFEVVVAWCRFHKIPLLPCYAGQFAIMDLESVLNHFRTKKTLEEKEEALSSKMLKAGVLMFPTGQDQYPTRYRLVFVRPRDVLQLGLRRLETAFGLPHMSEIGAKGDSDQETAERSGCVITQKLVDAVSLGTSTGTCRKPC
ncbi:PLP-dependent transferase [Coniophora puteana RWD-64-598 SS2]|uniref:PLP-dependent transferase n=1 Tax=Coniophora puteana (strain RWD-64-598) TaxID=741705 RepID=A0A5M3N4S5_CONPW|nr:PLP-dependent transferase [Coniophora puteana RWD-64-598 SS2]EIW86054.1 PLP-dependent transferase [Coniophora puteana RWD-64-598 SS2]